MKFKFNIGDTVTFLGLRIPVNRLVIPQTLAHAFLGPGIWGPGLTVRAKLLPKMCPVNGHLHPRGQFVYNPAGQVGVIVEMMSAAELWVDEWETGNPIDQPEDNGYFWLSQGKTYLIFEDELILGG